MPTEQEQTKEDQKWTIPQGCGLEKIMTLLVAIRNKNGDKEYVEDEKVKSAIDLSNSLIPPNLAFLNSVKLLERESKKTKLTNIGNELTQAWVRKDENISKLIEQVIKDSHLIDLYDYLKTNQGITTAKIFSFIKERARITDAGDGRPFGDIPFQGAKTIIRLFEKANLLTSEQVQELKDYKNTNPNSPATKSKKTKSSKKTAIVEGSNISQDSRGNLSLTSGIEIQLNSSKNVKFAILQLNDLFEELKKYENTNDESDIEIKDENLDDESDSEMPPSET